MSTKESMPEAIAAVRDILNRIDRLQKEQEQLEDQLSVCRECGGAGGFMDQFRNADPCECCVRGRVLRGSPHSIGLDFETAVSILHPLGIRDSA